jgi:hypothetical protein
MFLALGIRVISSNEIVKTITVLISNNAGVAELV